MTTDLASPAVKPTAATQPPPLAIALEAAKATATKMAGEIKAQRNRYAEIERLTEEKNAILGRVESGELEFLAGKKALCDANDSVELHQHNATRRAAALKQEFSDCRAELIGLRIAAVGTVKRCLIRLIDDRQHDARLFLASLGGSVNPNAWPVAVADLIAACPTLCNLSQLCRNLDEWSNASPASQLLRAVKFACDFIAAKNLTEADIVGAEENESKLFEPTAVLAWFPNRPAYDVFATCSTKAEADEIIHQAATSSTLAGARRIARVAANGSPTRFANSRNALVGEVSSDGAWLRIQGWANDETKFLEAATNFLAVP